LLTEFHPVYTMRISGSFSRVGRMSVVIGKVKFFSQRKWWRFCRCK
jgi:hypothetical protein